MTFTSEDLRIPADARADLTGEYVQVRAAEDTRERTFSAGGQSTTVSVVTHVREYSRNASVAGLDTGSPVARFTVLSTPKVEVLGRTFNPVADLTPREIALRLQSRYEGLSDVRFRENRTVTALGGERVVSTFAARADVAAGQEIDVTVHVATFPHREDFVVGVAIHPRAIDERGRIDAMLRALEHPG